MLLYYKQNNNKYTQHILKLHRILCVDRIVKEIMENQERNLCERSTSTAFLWRFFPPLEE